MTIKSLIAFGNSELKTVSPSPLLDARVLACHFLQCSSTDLIIRENEDVPAKTEKLFYDAIEKRKQNYPIAYITGTKEFFGREFEVNEDVLIPRPETEELVDCVLKELRFPTLQTNQTLETPQTILDLGTGSGCIAITMKKEMPELKIFAGDISEKSLAIAKRNAQKHGVEILFFQTDLLNALSPPDKGGKGGSFFPKQFLILIANLPYVSDSARDPSILREPESALFSGADGLDHYRRLSQEMQDFQKTHGFPVCKTLVLEIDDAQADAIPSIFLDAKNVEIIKDIGGKRRIAVILSRR